ncbi:spermidine synthase [Nakamurella endophytica]|uniref:Spermidine synthase n=1 Tax=Nakamurella endophytica TaxID=1748367 RepID=A0A917SKV7_9ACTN|nr:fused MFS/spermidine synthase [Nakamurella endophytica]GGL85438.1 spermidine synthase [Nakamurella endophytica]
MQRRPRPTTSDGPAGPAPGRYPIDTGTAELIRDRDRPRGYMLVIDDMESSHADLDDPGWLEFEYLRWMAAVIEHRQPEDAAFLTVHLGAAGCSLARHLVVSRPRSRHLAVEIDATLAALTRQWFDLPRAPVLRIRIGDARTELEALPPASANVIVRDVFSQAVTPWRMITAEFTAAVRRALRPGGVYLLNCADGPDLATARAEAATVAAAFPHVMATADTPMLKGRRRGNIVLAASDEPLLDADLLRALWADPLPAAVWDDAQLRTFASVARVLHDDQPPGPRAAPGRHRAP